MYYLGNIKRFLFFIYFIGIAPCPVGGQSKSKLYFVSDILKYFNFISCLFLSWHFYYVSTYRMNELFTSSDAVVFVLDMIFEIFRSVAVFLQCVFYQHHFHEIRYYFTQIELNFNLFFCHRISYETLKTRFTLKMVVILGAYLQYLIGHFMRIKSLEDLLLTSQLRILQAMTILTFLHFMVYIDALNFYFNQLNTVVRSEMKRNQFNSIAKISMAHRLKYRNRLYSMKVLHYQLWKATQYINDAFGWIGMALILYTFSDVVLCLIWFYEEIKFDKDVWSILSE